MHGENLELSRIPDLEAYTDRASALELVRRSLLGAPVYTVISLIILAGTPMPTVYGRWAVVEAVALILLGAVRVWFALSFERRYDQIGERAVNQFNILTALQSLSLGVLSAMVIWQYWAAREVILTIVLSAGCIAAGTSALSVRSSAHLIFLGCVLAPFGIAVFLVAGWAQAALIVGFLSLMAFLVQDGGQAKRAYFERLKEHYSKEISRRRAALEIQAKQEFTKEISHNIRAPVNSIIGMTALLLDEKLGQRAGEIAETIRKSSNSLLSLIGDTPGAIKIVQDTPEAQLGALELKLCVNNVMDLYALEASEKGLKITTLLEDLPDNIISSNQSQLEQVLANLMANAVEFTDEGAITLSASCEGVNNGAVIIEFALADTGKGIPIEYRELKFNPFNTKGAKTGDEIGGDGLGLPMCKGLVELMGGDIWIEDNEDQGTIVKFTIPAQLDPSCSTWEPAQDTPEKPENIMAPSSNGAFGDLSQFCPQHILVVDDDDIHRQILCTHLQKMGYKVDEAEDGEQAIAAVMQGGYDLIFMDLRMPNMNGVESTHWIRERFDGGGIRIIAITGDATIEARKQCLRAGMDNFVTKPVQAKDLEAILCHKKHDQNIQTPVAHASSVH